MEQEEAVAVSVCPYCGRVRTAYDCPCRVEAYKRKQGVAADAREGRRPLSGKPVAEPDLIQRAVRDDALRRAIMRT